MVLTNSVDGIVVWRIEYGPDFLYSLVRQYISPISSSSIDVLSSRKHPVVLDVWPRACRMYVRYGSSMDLS